MSQALAGRAFTFRLRGGAGDPACFPPCRTRDRAERRAGRCARVRSFRATRRHDRSRGRAPWRGPGRSATVRSSVGGPRPSLSRCGGRPLCRSRARRESEPAEPRSASAAARGRAAVCDPQGRGARDGVPGPGSRAGRPSWASLSPPGGAEPSRPPRRHRPRASARGTGRTAASRFPHPGAGGSPRRSTPPRARWGRRRG
jgi:hypothetical protein